MRTPRLPALLLATFLAFGFKVGAQTANPTMPNLPPALSSGNLKPYLAVFAKGVQIYVCNKVDNANWIWAFKAPEAELFDAGGTLVGRHYAGPTWAGTDRGTVVGTVTASADAPVPDAIAWLRVEVRSREGTGVFTQASRILRVSTFGGKAPNVGCDEARIGSELRVPYTATYYFLK
jgi:hypothetical protein